MNALLLSALAAAGTMQVDMLDVGQGDAILVRTPAGRSILIDGGTGGDDVVPMLRALGVESLTMIIATHPHADHIGGLDEVIAEFPPKAFFDSGQTHTTATYAKLMEQVESQGLAYFTAEAGWSRELDDGIVIEFLGPPSPTINGSRSDLNSNSVITRITHGEQCFLFTGDAEEPTERLLLQRGIEACEVLKVAHHGSAHSTTREWLWAIEPEIALISCGEGNRYGHPAEETLDRLSSAGATIYRTDLLGTVHLESDGESITVTAERGTLPNTPEPQVYHPLEISSPEPPVQTITATTAAATASTASTADPAGLININKASQSELEGLPGIGEKKAAAIIEYRMSMGAFTDIEQLDNVPGIGPKTMEKIRPLVTH